MKRRDSHASIASVSALSRAAPRGTLRLGVLNLPCAMGRTGIRALKREGDGATPAGRLRISSVLYRGDRLRRPRTSLPVRSIRKYDGWCDTASDRNYNRPVRLPYPASTESLWRADHLYDVVVVLDYNMRPRISGRGSAIFMHLAHPDYAPTAGCIALQRSHLLHLLSRLAPGAAINVAR